MGRLLSVACGGDNAAVLVVPSRVHATHKAGEGGSRQAGQD